jgi:hypothetical protein
VLEVAENIDVEVGVCEDVDVEVDVGVLDVGDEDVLLPDKVV